MKTFKHDIKDGKCYYLEIPLINRDVDALALAANFLMDIPVDVPARVGVARLNPKDKHYVKKIGREVAERMSFNTTFKVLNVVKRGKRVRLEIF